MKKRSRIVTIFLTVCLVMANAVCVPQAVSARNPVTEQQVKRLAKKQIKGGIIVEMDQEYEKGVLVYEIQMLKGKKEYELTYRASDGKLISYGWEMQSYYVRRGRGGIISAEKCRRLVKKQISNVKIISTVLKRSHGVDIYKVKAQKGTKKYELKFHARTGKLLEYEWELTVKKNNGGGKNYISGEQAKKAALARTGGGTVVKVKFEMDHGVPVYEVEVIKGELEYEIKIHARTGKILEVDIDSIYD